MSNTYILLCSHCGNKTPHQLLMGTETSDIWDEFGDQKIIEMFVYQVVQCGTCKHISLLGGFQPELPPHLIDYPLLYPASPELDRSVPEAIRHAYAEAARIRKHAPNAYAGQIRKAIEYLCKDKGASGRDLYSQLKSLADKHILPATLAEMTDLIREIGNAGVHIDKGEVSIWDAGLIDEFFKSIINYVYIAPAKIEHLKRLLAAKNNGDNVTRTDTTPN